MNQQFDNMIKVLAYFADQCDMFKPMLDGVNALRTENQALRARVEVTDIFHNRMQLHSTYAADYAQFGVETVRMAQASTPTRTFNSKKGFKQNLCTADLITLFKEVIKQGKGSYDRVSLEEMLDFYSMTETLDFDIYMELWDAIDAQHQEPEPEMPPVVEPEVPPTTDPDMPSTKPAVPGEDDIPKSKATKKKK